MNRIAKFEKVSLEQFKKDMAKLCPTFAEEKVVSIYENIKLPTRATSGSAGYDFKMPYNLNLTRDDEIVVPTGIRCNMENGWVLHLYPRSGLGFKYGMYLANTVGVIDSDYFYSDNEGHIMAKIGHNSSGSNIELKVGDGFAQGIFLEYGITTNDNCISKRNGGFGSTDSTERR